MSRTRALLVLGVTLGLSSGCRDGLERFDTGPNEAYCGSIVSSGFVRDEFPVPLRLRATIDTDNLSTLPGTLASDDADETESNPCAPQPRLKQAPMYATEALLHDPLSTFEFGTGRDHNFFAWVESCEGWYLATVSLMRNDDVEVRLMKPPAPPADAGAAAKPPGFALFQLERQKGDCGF